MNKPMILMPITGIIILTLVGCGTMQTGNPVQGTQGVHSTGAQSNVSTQPENTESGSSVSVRSTKPSRSNYAAEIALIRTKGYTVSGTIPNATVKTASGATLSAWLGITGNDGYNQFVFFFLDGKYLGTDTMKPSIEITSVMPRGHGITVTYPVYTSHDSFADPTGTPVAITYTWTGNRLVPNKPHPKEFQASSTAGLSVHQTANEGSSAAGSFHQLFKSEGSAHEVFLNASLGFQVTNLGGGAGNFEYQFAQTTDGGKTWTKRSTGRFSDIEGISFINDKIGYLLNNSPAYNITPDLFVTQDGGATWTEQKLPIPGAYKSAFRSSDFPIFFSSMIGFIPVYGLPAQNSTSNRFLYMLVTTNGGKTWTAYNQSGGDGLKWDVSNQTLSVIAGRQTITIHGLFSEWNIMSTPDLI